MDDMIVSKDAEGAGRGGDAATAAFCPHDHGDCTASGLAAAQRLAGDRGIRLTAVRLRVLEILLESHRAVGAYEILERLGQEGFGKQPPVVYRALDFLVENGLAHRVRRLNAFAACLHPGETHQPVFLICRECRRVAEAPSDAVNRAMAETASALGFRTERATVEVLGLCPACAGGGPDAGERE